MKIGFSNLYSFRPHVEHLYYLSTLLSEAGHEALFLTCDAGLSNCYPRALKGSSKLKECPKCMMGGVRSYPVSHVTSVSRGAAELDGSTLDQLALSSSCTLARTEANMEWLDPEVSALRQSLHAPIATVYRSALRWIERNKIEAVVCFNGRMDITRALIHACEQAGIPYITHERTWFGDGLNLIPNENCMSTAAVDRMVHEFENKPLTLAQARLAGKLVSDRFLQRNSLEWRVYNKNPDPAPWPLQAAGPRVLVLPSSRNEFAGHADWRAGWENNTDALDDFFEAFSIQSEQVVVRGHPNWAENIGKVSGERSLAVYREWVKKRGIHFISSEQKTSTYDLIQQADMVVLNGGSSAVEAGVCGKQVICLGPVNYQHAGFVRVFCDRAALYRPDALQPIDADIVIRKTLRFLYLSARRFPQFVDHVRAIKTTRYAYFEGADPERLMSMFKSGCVAADDATHASDTREEDQVVEALMNRELARLSDYAPPIPDLKPLDIGRRWGLRWIDNFRDQLPRGDLG